MSEEKEEKLEAAQEQDRQIQELGASVTRQ